jgi:RND superfamily putative drug exporter
VLAIGGALLTLLVMSTVTDVSVFGINLVTALGIGLGIDYALCVVSRFREELARGADVEDAVLTTVRTSGRTIVFSALTVALALASMLVFPLFFLRSFAYAGIPVVLAALVGALLPLPALLAVLGRRVDRFTVLRSATRPSDSGLWLRVATAVMRRPVAVAVPVVLVLGVLVLPFLGASWGQADDRALPPSDQARQAGDLLRAHFPQGEGSALTVVLPGRDDPAAVASYAAAVSRVRGVDRVDGPDGSWSRGRIVAAPTTVTATRFRSAGGSWLSVTPGIDPFSTGGAALVRTLRALPAPGTALVGGAGAVSLDTVDAVEGRLPWALAVVGVSTFVLLFLFTGSVVLPAKALVLNLLSLSATFGAMVWVFQDGHGSGLLGFTATGSLQIAIAVLMFCVTFGLSMDYEVFLLSRIKEEYDRTGDNNRAVALGLQRSGRIVTAAAALMAVVFVAFATSRVSTIKMMGLGIALAIVVDATLVRALLVPAFMRLAGEWNWWAPGPLRRLHSRAGLTEGPAPVGAGPSATTDPRVS